MADRDVPPYLYTIHVYMYICTHICIHYMYVCTHICIPIFVPHKSDDRLEVSLNQLDYARQHEGTDSDVIICHRAS